MDGGDRQMLIVEALVEMGGTATQSEVEEWLLASSVTVDLLGKWHSSPEQVNSWVGVMILRMKRAGILEVVGKGRARQKGHGQPNLYGLAVGICHHCGKAPLKSRS